MRAILKNDQILKLTISKKAGVEIGDIPKGIGLERLRFDGDKIIDLHTLDHIWVDNYFNLHCIDIGDCQLVQMTYRDRKNLIDNNGIIQVKTSQDIEQEKEINNEIKKGMKVKQKLKKEFGSLNDYQIKRDKCLWATIDYLLNDNTDNIQFVRNNLDKVKNILGIN